MAATFLRNMLDIYTDKDCVMGKEWKDGTLST